MKPAGRPKTVKWKVDIQPMQLAGFVEDMDDEAKLKYARLGAVCAAYNVPGSFVKGRDKVIAMLERAGYWDEGRR